MHMTLAFVSNVMHFLRVFSQIKVLFENLHSFQSFPIYVNLLGLDNFLNISELLRIRRYYPGKVIETEISKTVHDVHVSYFGVL